MLFDITEPEETEPNQVRVLETHVGKGVFAVRPYPPTAIIGQITGDITLNPTEPEYTFDFENGYSLEPYAPFRFVNHSCDPNCEFEILDVPETDDEPAQRNLYLIAVKEIQPEEQLTISYNWPADCAIECHCESENCVGWIVCETEIDQIIDRYDDDFELEYEFHNIDVYFPD